MITHEEALELVKILYFNINEKTNQELNRTSKIYDKLDNYIAQQEKKEKLLKLYQELDKINGWLLLCFTIGGEEIEKEYSQLGGGNRRQELIKQIKEIENENM